MNHYWSILAIAPTNDTKAVKKAYATRLKQVRPDEDPVGFQRLREAYEWALKYGVVWAKHHLEESDDEDADESFDDVDEPQIDANAKQSSPSDSRNSEPFTSIPVHIAQGELSFLLPASMLGLEPPSTIDRADTEPSKPSTPPPLIARVEDTLPNYRDLPPIADLRQPAQRSHAPIAVATEPPLVRAEPQVMLAPIALPELSHRSIEVFLQALWDQGQRARTPTEIKQWLALQAEFESLHQRIHLDDALQSALSEHNWPWNVVIAVAELLEWGTIGNEIEPELEHALLLAYKQAQIINAPKPSWRKQLSVEGYRYAMRQPFRWRDLLWRSLLPSKAAVDAAFYECLELGIDPQLVYDPIHVRVQAALRLPGFNLVKTLVGIWRCIFWPLAISLITAFATRVVNVRLTLIWIGIFLIIWLVGTIAKWCHEIIWSQYPTHRHPPFLYRMLGILAGAALLETLYAPDGFVVMWLPCLIAVFVAGKRWSESAVAVLLGAGLGVGGFAVITAMTVPSFNAERWMGLAFKVGTLIAALGVHYYVRRHFDAHGHYRPPEPKPVVRPEQQEGKIPWWLIIWIVILIARFAGN